MVPNRVRIAIHLRHFSRRTEKAYVGWIKRFILFHGKRHPAEMGPDEITAFLSALLFLYRVVLDRNVPWLEDLVRAKRPGRLPVVLSRDEVRAVLSELHGDVQLITMLLYGAGLRLLECARLRAKDVDLDGYDIRTAQTLLGHRDVRTTMIYTHVLGRGPAGVLSPVDRLLADRSEPGAPARGYTDPLVRISLKAGIPPSRALPTPRR